MTYKYSDGNNYMENHNDSSLAVNMKYKRKYRHMKRLVKDIVFENGALCDHVAQMQEKLVIVKEERRYLLRKLYQFQAAAEAESQLQVHNVKVQSAGHSPPSVSSEGSSSVKKTSIKKRASSTDTPDSNSKMNAKPKKAVAIPKTKKMVQPIPLDTTGRPVFPIVLGGPTVHSLGEVVSDRPDYHTEEFIFPVGFCSTRVYGSLREPEKKCVYTCKVLDGGSSPSFEIVADNELDAPLVARSANDCHSLLLRHINNAVGIEVVNTQGRGPEFFGFSHPTIQNLIQSSPGTRKCAAYRWSKFEVSRTGEPPVEENDASLSFDALQRSIAFSKSHMRMMKIKEEQPEQMLRDSSNASLRDLLMS